MRYQLSSAYGKRNLTVYAQDELHGIDDTMPYFDNILNAVLDDDEDAALDLIDLSKAAQTKFESVTDRVSVSAGTVYFDGDAIHTSLADAIVRAMEQGSDFAPLARFMEKCYQNPNKHSRENMYDWLSTHDFTITPNGNLLAYKGVNGDLTSLHAGPGFVDGQPMNGHIPNQPGSVISISRSYVQHDPEQGCSTGLHVGTWGYASSFGDVTLKVEINPRDIVSVPTDCGAAKMRVSRYKVIKIIDNPVRSFVDDESEWETWDA